DLAQFPEHKIGDRQILAAVGRGRPPTPRGPFFFWQRLPVDKRPIPDPRSPKTKLGRLPGQAALVVLRTFENAEMVIACGVSG
ncbi:hypothetical protein, partial [Rhodopseudomonas sp. BAL398]|uniref:hypothetical protein n=1 Tax=Rhodopseudomonas sp. BAL398 TaxID=3034676 RepID=UPI0023E13981